MWYLNPALPPPPKDCRKARSCDMQTIMEHTPCQDNFSTFAKECLQRRVNHTFTITCNDILHGRQKNWGRNFLYFFLQCLHSVGWLKNVVHVSPFGKQPASCRVSQKVKWLSRYPKNHCLHAGVQVSQGPHNVVPWLSVEMLLICITALQ